MALIVLIERMQAQMPIIDRWLKYLDLMQVRHSHSIHPKALTARETADAKRQPRSPRNGPRGGH
jgi:hypothetical protein